MSLVWVRVKMWGSGQSTRRHGSSFRFEFGYVLVSGHVSPPSEIGEQPELRRKSVLAVSYIVGKPLTF
ncbi:hypothetical protein Hanom_Chr11g01031631 [Helianthus anomalus]